MKQSTSTQLFILLSIVLYQFAIGDLWGSTAQTGDKVFCTVFSALSIAFLIIGYQKKQQ